MVNIFKATDNFLTDCEEYVDTRVWNGKFISDIKYISEKRVEDAKDSYEKKSKRFQSSNQYTATILFVKRMFERSMQIPLLSEIILLTADNLQFHTKHFAHYLILLIINLFSAFLLLSLFQINPWGFSLLLLPVLLLNHLVLTGFYSQLEKKSSERISIEDTVTLLKQTFRTNCYLFLLQVSAVALAIMLLFGCSFILSSILGALGMDWGGSFLYWLLFCVLSLFIAWLLFTAEFILYLAYPFTLINKFSSVEAINTSWNLVRRDFRRTSFMYVLVGCMVFIVMWNAIRGNFEGGISVSLLFCTQAFLLLGFLLRKRNFFKQAPQANKTWLGVHRISKTLLILGILSYTGLAVFLAQIHPSIMRFLFEQHPSVSSHYEYKTFNNFEAGYSIAYPLPWSVYRWNDTSITINTNDKGTNIGGVKINIDLYPAANSNYLTLYEADPELIIYDTETKAITTKIANFSKQGKNGVKYTYTKQHADKPEFQTHYLIHDDGVIYDIAFIAASKKIESSYEEVFNKMFESFQFLTD